MILYYTHDKRSQLLQHMLDIKKISYTIRNAIGQTAIYDNGLLIDDVIIAIKYLDQRYPKPKLFGDTPEQTARLDLFVSKLVNDVYINGEDSELRQLDHLLFTDRFIFGSAVSVADLALLPIVRDYTAWQPYQKRIEAAIRDD